jgi:hypothetical protein
MTAVSRQIVINEYDAVIRMLLLKKISNARRTLVVRGC